MANPFDQFDTQPAQNNVQANPFDQFDSNTGDIVSSSIIKGAAGLAGLPADLLTMAGSALGVKPEFAQYLGKDAIIKGIEKLTGTPLYRPEGDVERYAGKAIEGAISTPGRLPMMAMGAASGVGGEFGNEMAGTPGAIAGSLAPYVIPAVAGKAIGGLADLVRGRTTDIRAGGVLRDVSVGNPAIETSMIGKPDTLTAAQAAAAADDPLWSALGERAKANRARPFTRKLTDQDLSIIERLRGVAGGNTATEARQAQDVFKRGINIIRGPERELAIDTANIAGKELPKLQGEADRLSQAALDKIEDVRRFGAAGQRAENLAQNWFPVAGMPRTPGRYSYADELAKRAESVVGKSADESRLFGDAAKFKQMQADSLAAHGLKPLKPDTVISKIDNMLKDPRIGPDDISSGAISNVRDKLAAWTNKDGIIDAEAIETIRKRAVNDAVERFMGAADPKAKAKRAAAVTARIRPLLVKAIEDAGGKGYGEYLKKYAADMDKLASQKLGAKLLEKYEQSPDAFLKMAKGNDPKLVQKIMTDEYDISKALGGRNKTVQDITTEIERNNRLAELAVAGKTELANILSKDASKFRLPMWLNRYVTAANKGLDIAEETLNAKTMAKVYEAMESPSKALKLINEIPTSERSAFIKKLIELKKMPKEVRAAQEMSQREY